MTCDGDGDDGGAVIAAVVREQLSGGASQNEGKDLMKNDMTMRFID